MSNFKEKMNISNFTVETMDLSEIDELSNWLPKNGIVDLNIAEIGLVKTLHGQNLCQEYIVKVDRWISQKEGEKNKKWSKAALEKSTQEGYKTIKLKEWFAQSDDEYIEASNDVAIAKAAKKWLENKAGYFSGWHYAFKTFLKRDYSLEKLGNFQLNEYNNTAGAGLKSHNLDGSDDDVCGELEWGE